MEQTAEAAIEPVVGRRVPRPSGDDATAYVLGGRGGLRRTADGALGTWLGVLAIGILVAIPLRGLYKFTGGTMEEGFMLDFPELIKQGKVPNVDFLHLYGPGSLDVLALWYRIFGNTLTAERTFGLLQHLGIIFGLFALARPWGRLAATLVGALAVFYVLTPIGLTAMAWNGALALVLWSAVAALRGLHVEGDGRRRAFMVAGVLAGLAITYRPDLVVAVALVFGWLFWRHRAARWPVVVGGVVGLLPMGYHVLIAGLGPSFEGMVIDPVFHLRAGRELPRPPSWSHIDGALQAIAEQIPPWWRFPHLAVSNALFLWFFAMIGVTIAFLAYAIVVRRRGDAAGPPGSTAVLLVVALIGVGILPQGLQRPDSTHLTWVTCITWPFAIVVVADAVRRRWPITRRAAVGVGAAVALAATFVLTSLFTFRYYLLHTRVGLGQVPSAVPVTRDGRTFYFGSARAAVALQAAVDDLDAMAAPGERLLVGPKDLRRTWYSDLVAYWMFPELEPATYYMEMDPGLANAPGSSLPADVASADWVLLTGFWDGWYEPNTSIDYGPDTPNQVIRDHFCEVGSYEDALVVLYRRCR